MTVNTNKITSGPYIGNGIADTFSYGFKVFDKSELNVYQTTDGGVETLLVVDTDYTVNGVGVDAGGTVTRVAGALPSDYQWYIRSNFEETQLTSFTSQGPFFPDLHEDAMDKLTLLIQQTLDSVNRSLSVSDSYTGVTPLLVDDPEAGKLLLWKDDLTGTKNVALAEIDPNIIPEDTVTYNFDTALGVVNSAVSFAVNKALKIKGYHSISDGGHAEYIVKSGSGPTNQGNLPLFDGKHAALQPTTILKAKNFGIKTDNLDASAPANTKALWAMSNKAKAMGGAILLFDDGADAIRINLADSENTYACWRIPSNCIVQNGKFRRIASERGDDGILIANDNHDTSDTPTIIARAAATNITFDGVDISDEALTPNRVRGDLFAIVHCTDVTIKNCKFGNHDQHCADVGNSKNVYIYQNTGVNDIVTTDACADFQMDWGNAYGTTNTSAINNAGCENVYIYNNDMKSAFAEQQIHWHFGNHINTNAYHNKLETSGNGGNFGADNTPQQGLTTLNVYNNYCITNDFAGAFFRCKSGRNNIFQNDDVNVYKNYITGKCRSGAVMGFSQSPNVAHANTENFNCSVTDNVFDLDWSGVTSSNAAEIIAGKYWHNFKATGNIIKINVDTLNHTGGLLQLIYDQNNQDTLIDSNKIILTGAATFIEDGRCLRGLVDHCVTNSERRTIKYTNNDFIASGFKYQIGINTTSGIETFKLLTGRIGGNTLQGTTIFAEMFTPYPLSDGTNNAGYVDFSTTAYATLTGQDHWLALSVGTRYADIPLPGSAAASNNFGYGKVTLHVEYAGSLAGIETARRPAQMWLEGAGSAVGVEVSSIDIDAGTFDLQTGNTGTFLTFNASGVPSTLSNGYARVWAGI